MNEHTQRQAIQHTQREYNINVYLGTRIKCQAIQSCLRCELKVEMFMMIQ